MFIFDQLKKEDPQLRAVALLVLGGLGVLVAGLWWVQIAMCRTYQASLETQSFRTVRIPAVRGKILDRNGTALAENRPTYNISIYFEELRQDFDAEYFRQLAAARTDLKNRSAALSASLKRSLNKQERRQFALASKQKLALRQTARAIVGSNLVWQIGRTVGQQIPFDPATFEQHYQTRLALPYPVVNNLNPKQIALFQEQSNRLPGVDLDVQSFRVYPFQTEGAHILGRLQRWDKSQEGEEAFFSYRLPDYRGLVGLEMVYDRELRGSAGAKSLLVNNVGYRQTEKVWVAAEPGRNLVLTIDWGIQQAAEHALQAVYGPATRGAVVVMDVQTGDILAMASSPSLNPNHFVQGFPRGEWDRIVDVKAELNRATHERYAPGSVFKMVVGLAALEAGLNPNEIYNAAPNPQQPGTAVVYVGKRPWKDTAPPGSYDFKRALKLSCNSYFITMGLRFGPERVVRMGQRLHLGEKTGLLPYQETPGDFPSLDRVRTTWTDGNTANLSIGQDPVLVTPLQVAVLTSAIANGGKVLWPRVADRLEAQDPMPGEKPVYVAHPQVRDDLGLKPRTLSIMHQAMLADVEDSDGTGTGAAVPGMRICGKTGTAQVKDLQNHKTGQITWFASFAPYEKPRYAVVVMVENGISGGRTCAPVAGKVYAAIQALDRQRTGSTPVASNR